MNRETSSSRLVAFEEIKRNWLKHEDRLIHIRPMVTSRFPPPRVPTFKKCNYPHVLSVQLENKSLLKKLTDRVHSRPDSSVLGERNTLSHSNRKKYYEEYKIKSENEGLFQRLNEVKASYETSKILGERRATEKYLNTISKFGYKNLRPNKTMMKFQFQNNQLKYLSKRRIIINQKFASAQNPKITHRQSEEDKIIQMENQRFKNNQKLFHYFSRPKKIQIDNNQIMLKITRGSLSLLLELKNTHAKQNRDNGELQVNIPRTLFKEKFKEDLESLIDSLRYNQSSNIFYIM